MELSSLEMSAIERGFEQGFEQGLEQGRQKGLEQGRQEFLCDFVPRLLAKKLGELSARLQAQIRRLSAEQLEALSEALFDFDEVKGLREWLNRHPPKNTRRPQMKARTKKKKG